MVSPSLYLSTRERFGRSSRGSVTYYGKLEKYFQYFLEKGFLVGFFRTASPRFYFPLLPIPATAASPSLTISLRRASLFSTVRVQGVEGAKTLKTPAVPSLRLRQGAGIRECGCYSTAAWSRARQDASHLCKFPKLLGQLSIWQLIASKSDVYEKDAKLCVDSPPRL